MSGRTRTEAADAAMPAGGERPLTDELARGTNQTGVRLYNERLVLSLIRRHESLPKAEIARLTGLSPQTITIIMRALEADGLVVKRSRQRGKVGQPSVPFALNPDGALSIGVKIGRRSADVVLIDFTGRVRASASEAYRYPQPDAVIGSITDSIARMTADAPADRIAGTGIAMPFELWNWETEVKAPRRAMQAWRDRDVRAEIAGASAWPVHLCNDATAACAAELVFGNHSQYLDFLYIFVGWFVGGGVVLNGSLFPGRTGYAGAVGPMPVPVSGKEPARFHQLIHSASIYTLERAVIAAKGRLRHGDLPADWTAIEQEVGVWIETVAADLALAVVSAMSVIDFEAVVIDGSFPDAIRTRVVDRVRVRLADFDRQGLPPFTVAEGSLGPSARAIGGACLPLLANFARDRDVLFKETA